MGRIVINGGNALFGELKIQGSKNAVLPILSACVLCADVCTVKNCPDISDVRHATEIIEALGGKIKKEGNVLIVDTRDVSKIEIPKELMQKMRSSVMFLGAILARCGKAEIYTPGGCEIGSRPVDIHIKALRELGTEIKDEGEKVLCKLEKIKPSDIGKTVSHPANSNKKGGRSAAYDFFHIRHPPPFKKIFI